MSNPICYSGSTPVLAVIMSGGIVQNIQSTSPVEVVLVDYDVDGCDPTDPHVVDVYQDGGGTELANIRFFPVEIKPDKLGSIRRAAIEAEGRKASAENPPAWPPVLPFEQAFTNILHLVVEEFHRRLLDRDNYTDQREFNQELLDACRVALRLLTGKDEMTDALREGLFDLAQRAGISWSPTWKELA